QAEPFPVLVESNSVDLEHRYVSVGRELKESHLVLIRDTYRDRVAVANLPDAGLPADVGNCAPLDVGGLQEPRGAPGHQGHGAEWGWAGPREAIDEALVVPTDQLGTFVDPESIGQVGAGQLYGDLKLRRVRSPPASLHLCDVDVFLTCPRISCQRAHEGVGLV